MAGRSEKFEDRMRCEFLLVRYVADRVKGEFVNIGVLLRESAPGEDQGGGQGGKGGGPIAVRFTRDWRRVRCLDPAADIAALEALEADLGRRLGSEEHGAAFLSSLEDSLSNGLQLTRPKSCLAENLPAEMDRLMRLYVERQKGEPAARRSARQSIYGAMRREFERGGVWSFMDTQIPVARYIGGADPLRIDCGYRNGGIRMFQAMAAEDIAAAKVLAFTAPALSKGIFEQTGLGLELTAIGEPLDRDLSGKLAKNDDELALYESGVRIMESASIRFLTTARLPEIVERARQELRI